MPVHFAVIGESGSGKSSFINALRGVGHEGDNVAPVGVRATTKERTPYQHPKIPKMIIWDLPGMGTPAFQNQNYVKEMKFDEYDCFIIISCTRVKETDAYLAKQIHKMKKNFYFVRTKVDNDVHEQQRNKPNNFNKDSVLKMIRDDCLNHLTDTKVTDPRVFLVSSFDVSDYDFPNLVHILSEELPGHNRLNFMLSFPNITDDVIECKKSILTQMIQLKDLVDRAFATIFLPESISNSDVNILVDTVNKFRTIFGLDDVQLRKMAKNLNVSLEELKLGIKSANILTCMDKDKKSANILEFAECIHVSTRCITKKSIVQLYALHLVAEDAKALLKNEKIFR
ncbi:T-cell-specific guanine nucleotide triphosphate-binding protein 2-like [Dasypus novemcinctus]|uniref:T-cell-specific guanine nucleotide triphosphate-binding protein 2-like n=1 Tax=Dasypus novemcinctus TaxID=9361 RepID=UPI0003289542|nr:T-cell-specific guanine nucleotide triphosphate-binding protein 2-like [Dasypus novemcinctus]